LLQLGSLYTELDDVASLPQRMGFPEKGSFEIFTLIKNVNIDNSKEELIKEFALDATEKIKAKIYIGWQDVPREYERIQTDIELLSVNPKYESLAIDENNELVDRIMRSVHKNFSLN